MKTRIVTEYRLLVSRAGQVKDWRARSMKAIVRRLGLLTSPEPWRFYGDRENRSKGPNDYHCCAGTYHDQCGCGGITMREQSEEIRKNLPPIESIRLEARQVVTTTWEARDVPPVVVSYPCDYCAGEHDTPACPLEVAEAADAVDPHVGVSAD